MSSNKKESVRVKTIKAVYSSLTVAEDAREWFSPETPVTNSLQVANLFDHLKQETKEVFATIHLNSKNCVLCVETVSIGCLNSTVVHPREVFQSALLSSAAGLVLVHNHPSGDPHPSREDLEMTKRLKEGGELLGIRVLDHVIIGDKHLSMADRGMF